MTATIINGNEIARQVRAELKTRADALKARGVIPGLAVIIVGDNPASHLYVKNKIKACAEVGLHSVHGILVQLPLPKHIASADVVDAISVDKDVDGFHYYNLGGLISGDTVFPPCTPYGVMRLLEASGITIEGQNAVVVGRSNIVGKPMALMLLQKGATVSICTSKTRDLAMYTRLADILVVATGKANLITAPMVKEGVVVIDVGINRLPDGKLAGDVDFGGVKEKASYITPVPGGVGPMTVTMLVANTIQSAERLSARGNAATAR
jgi:methylenetetrahydrofolate dehydrogenase (NADP+) / methenyltetrahydrofolate cyclohydrolase